MSTAPDLRALTVPAAQLDALASQDDAQLTTYEAKSQSGFSCAVALVVGFVLLILLITAVVSREGESWLILGILTLVVLAFAALAYGIRALTRPRARRKAQRFLLFCRANRLDPTLDVGTTSWPASQFGSAKSNHTVFRAQWLEDGAPFEVGTFSWYQSGGRSGTLHQFGYLAVPCSATIPHTFFSSGRTMSFTCRVPQGLQGVATPNGGKGQPTLHTPDGGADRVGTMFVPELVAVLADDERPFHAEIVDGWFFAYFSHGQEIDPARWRQLFVLAEVLRAHVPRQDR